MTVAQLPSQLERYATDVRCARCGVLVRVYGHVPARFVGSCCLVPVSDGNDRSEDA